MSVERYTVEEQPRDQGASLLALAERCEAASDDECTARLNADILRALGWTSDDRDVYDPAGNRRSGIPSYTTSLDAAMTLVPEGSLFTARTVWDKMRPAGLGFVSRYEKGEFGGHERLYWMDEHQAVAATPALALCGAALRALAASPTPDSHSQDHP